MARSTATIGHLQEYKNANNNNLVEGTGEFELFQLLKEEKLRVLNKDGSLGNTTLRKYEYYARRIKRAQR